MHPVVGIDLVRVSEVAASIEAWGDRYLRRMFSTSELEDCRRGDGELAVERLAARVAAKEAVLKVLRPSPETPVPWTSIVVDRAPQGWPLLRLSGAAAGLADRQGITGVSVSLSHQDDWSAAIAAALVAGPERGECSP